MDTLNYLGYHVFPNMIVIQTLLRTSVLEITGFCFVFVLRLNNSDISRIRIHKGKNSKIVSIVIASLCVCVCVCACVRACVRASVRACLCVCVCVRARVGGGWGRKGWGGGEGEGPVS